ncbi:nuA3 HAT complex component nto1 [Mortierella polycephala]|uniref:NuA3 HAT complex component nto1 n=1 Tax=Mortierella polycephala TaxID=41804 RepID=A0A9P6PSD0_9FUNG|nr:nuA3 HAT complex component nto1 [Mortierella polycephala]
MPHTNSSAPFLPRLEPPESDVWFAKVKAVPFHSPNFDCILPGCTNSYQTKQGLERHFVSIHMPKDPSAPTKQTRSSSTGLLIHRPGVDRRTSAGGRRGRIKSRRKGRPPGSGLKARLKQLELQQTMEQAPSEGQDRHQHADHHINHSLLAIHPASTRHDYGGDDESKPREERSYLEFFPFLNTSLRLDIVDPEQHVIDNELCNQASESTTQGEHTHIQTNAKAEGDSVSAVSNNMAVPSPSSTHAQSYTQTKDVFHDPVEPIPQDVLKTDRAYNVPLDSIESNVDAGDVCAGIDMDEDQDGDMASDPDVFFDAKGFIENDTGASQMESVPHNHVVEIPRSRSGDVAMEIGPEIMDIDEDKVKDDSAAISDTLASNVDDGAAPARAQSADSVQNDIVKSSVNMAHASSTAEQSSDILSTRTSSMGRSTVSVLEPKTPMSSLPKSSFRLIPHDDDDLEEYHLPVGHNLRYIEPTETELAERVEYDMDEQDEFWLKEINAERRKQDLGEVTASIFEKIIDRLEKEWFDLTKNIPKASENLPPEDSACNICDDGECENSNAIVFCDGCNLAVHQDCYGIPYIPEGQWLCRNWIPEVGVANTVYMEPIDNIDKIPASRWKLTCYICKLRMGACIQCETKNCFRAFHVTCARKAHLYMKSRLSKVSNSTGEVLVYRAHCHKHTPRDYKGVIDIAGAAALFAHKDLKKKRAKIRIQDDDSDDPDYGRSGDEDNKSAHMRLSTPHRNKSTNSTSALSASQSLGGSRMSKAALAHQKHYSPGAPLAPMYIVNRLLPFVSRLGAKTPTMRKASALSFIFTICKYWSLKRESRRGAPLLKRLHLEPWTASASAHRQTEEEKMRKLQTQVLLRGDLEKVRMLAELVRKRERAKLKRQEFQNRYLCKIMFPLKTILEDTLVELEKLDRQKYFAYPISAEEVKDYHDVIKDPICFQTINEKLGAHVYQTVEKFADDARRIYHNCLTYNKVDTPYYRAASRQLKQAEPLLQKAKEDYESLDIDPRTGFLAVQIDPEIFTYNLVPLQRPEGDDAVVSSAPDVHGRHGPTSESSGAALATGRSVRAATGRGAQPTRSSTRVPASTVNASKPAQDSKHGLDQTLPVSAQGGSGQRSEVPKLKTATKTRADAARARQDANDGGKPMKLDEEEDLLEKLKLKSKKSRSLATNLESRLKPSIVDKAVVINKPAPKGWAYVVMEGEEDTTEGEDDDDTNQASKEGEVQTVDQAKEEARRKRREESRALALKKRLSKEAKAKARAESYARFKAMKAQAATNALQAPASGSATSVERSHESKQTRLSLRRAHATAQLKAGNDGMGQQHLLSDHHTPEDDHDKRESGDVMDADADDALDQNYRVVNGKERKNDGDLETDVTDDIAEQEKTDEEPARKRQKKLAAGKGGDQEDQEVVASAINTRRLRSKEAMQSARVASGPRRGSSASQRSTVRGTVETTAAKRRRSESSDGSAKKQKSRQQGTPLPYGSLVWAKMEGFPWFPAELMDPKGQQVPTQAREAKKDSNAVHLVQFFDICERRDRGRSWYWVAPAQVSPLGVDFDEDRKRVHLKTSWNPKRRKTVKQAYIDACQLKGIDPIVVMAEST